MTGREGGVSLLTRAHSLLENEYKWEFMDMKAMFGKVGSDVRPASVATTRSQSRRAKPAKVTVNTRRCHHSSRDVVENIVSRLGWSECSDEQMCSLLWTGSHCEPEYYSNMLCFQKVNRFPGMGEMTSKVSISKSLRRMKSLYPNDYNFMPDTWILSEDFPRSYRKTQNGLMNTSQQDNEFSFPVTEFPTSSCLEAPQCSYHEKGVFILKPDNGAQGEGILMAESIADFDLATLVQTVGDDMIIQRYIDNPLLIDGYKFDMRIYVLITNVEELRVFRYEEGLARLCTQKYEAPNAKNFDKQYMHLTNYSLNKQNEGYSFNENAQKADEGSKRTLTAMNKFLREKGYDVTEVWEKVDDMIGKTVLAMQPQLWHNYRSCFGEGNDGSSCFQILGFDVLLDAHGQPWLLEVNHSPSFSCDTPLDTMVKEAVIMDTLKLVNFNIMSHPKRTRRRPQSRARSGPTKSVVAEEWGFHNFRPHMSEKQKQEERMGRLRKGALNAQPQHEDGSESSRLGGWKRLTIPLNLRGLHSEPLRNCFVHYAGHRLAEMNNSKFYRLLRDCGMLEGCRLTRAEIDLIFSDSIRIRKETIQTGNNVQQRHTASTVNRGVMVYPLFVDALTRFAARRFKKATYSESFHHAVTRYVEPCARSLESSDSAEGEEECGPYGLPKRNATNSSRASSAYSGFSALPRSAMSKSFGVGDRPQPGRAMGRLKPLGQRVGSARLSAS